MYIFICGVLFAIVLFILWLIVKHSQGQAKRVAKQMLSGGKLDDMPRVERVLKMLNEQNDEESKYLWHKLTELKEKQE